MNIYVQANKNTAGDGSFEAPFNTIEEARDYIKNTDEEDITVNIRGGRYFIKNTIRFTKDDKPAVYKAYNDEKVIFDGGIILDNSLAKKITDNSIKERIIEEKIRDEVYELDLSGYDIELAEYGIRGFRRMHIPSANELFINSKPQKVSEYPKEKKFIPMNKVIEGGNDLINGHDFNLKKPIIGYVIERGDKWAKAKDAYITGYLCVGYADDTIKIEKIDTKNRTLTLSTCSRFSIKEDTETKWKILNLLEEISEPGEYYIDIENKKLYFYPPQDIDMSSAFLQLSVLDTPMISFIGAKNIKFQGIVFENSRGSGVYIGGGESVNIDNCTFRNLGMIAVQVGQGTSIVPEEKTTGHGEYLEGFEPIPQHEMIGDWHGYLYAYAAWDGNGGRDHLISNCDMYDLGSGGVLLGGGNRKKLIPANNTVYNCHIKRINRLDVASKSAVNIWGVGNKVSHCDMHDLSGTCIYIHGNDHIIEYNKIHDVVKTITDGAAIYLGRDPSEVGNVIKHNFIYNIKNPHSYDLYGYTAIYFDDHAIYNEVYGNYFYDIVQRGPFFFSTIHWNGGGGTSVANNIFIDCYPGMDPNTYDNSYEVMHNTDFQNGDIFIKRVSSKDENDLSGVDVTSDIWKEKYPYLYDTYMNDFVQETRNYNNFVCCGQYQNFVDENPSNLNFKLRKDSYMFFKYARVHDRIKGYDGEKVYFKDIDFYSIGLVNDKRALLRYGL